MTAIYILSKKFKMTVKNIQDTCRRTCQTA